jgi:hypothetical protein
LTPTFLTRTRLGLGRDGMSGLPVMMVA